MLRKEASTCVLDNAAVEVSVIDPEFAVQIGEHHVGDIYLVVATGSVAAVELGRSPRDLRLAWSGSRRSSPWAASTSRTARSPGLGSSS